MPDLVVLVCRGPKVNYFGAKKSSYVCFRSFQTLNCKFLSTAPFVRTKSPGGTEFVVLFWEHSLWMQFHSHELFLLVKMERRNQKTIEPAYLCINEKTDKRAKRALK